jgi:hypothetical protein
MQTVPQMNTTHKQTFEKVERDTVRNETKKEEKRKSQRQHQHIKAHEITSFYIHELLRSDLPVGT